jgi:alkylglycerol monooxygenase
MTKSSYSLLAAIAVLVALTGPLFTQLPLAPIFKPLATILILSIAFANWRLRRDRYSFFILLGLLFSLVGDVALLWPARYFLFGLAAFLCTHIAYLFAFTRDVCFPARPGVGLIYFACASALYLFLFSLLPYGIKLPLALYSVLLASMASQALGRFLIFRNHAARLAAFGAFFFVISDSLLALDRFHAPIPHAQLLILIPYYVAQWLIVSSTDSP